MQVTDSLERKNVPQKKKKKLNAEQLWLSSLLTFSTHSFPHYFSVYSADPLSLDWEDYHEGRVQHVTKWGQMVDLSSSTSVMEVVDLVLGDWSYLESWEGTQGGRCRGGSWSVICSQTCQWPPTPPPHHPPKPHTAPQHSHPGPGLWCLTINSYLQKSLKALLQTKPKPSPQKDLLTPLTPVSGPSTAVTIFTI